MVTATKPKRTTWLLKGCPRCHGDLLIEDEEQNCIQCGYLRDLNPKKAFRQYYRKQQELKF